MSNKKTSPVDDGGTQATKEMARFREILEQQNLYKNRQKEVAITALKNGTPTPPEIRSILHGLIGDARIEVLSNHSFWPEMKIRQGLFALISTARTAFVDICKHEAAISTLFDDRHRFDDHIEFTIENPFQKDVMVYCSATVGMIDAGRRIITRRPDLDGQINNLIDTLYKDELTGFIKDLRNNLMHGSVIIPGWNITLDRGGGTGSMCFNSTELLLFGEWKKPAKQFIAMHPKIHLGETIRRHYEKINKFSIEIKGIFARNISSAETDYFKITDEQSRFAKQQWAKILVSQVGKGKNPYDYLHRFFKPEEVRQILNLPNHSKEQVELLISLKISDTDCDMELRKYLYEIFAVPTNDH